MKGVVVWGSCSRARRQANGSAVRAWRTPLLDRARVSYPIVVERNCLMGEWWTPKLVFYLGGRWARRDEPAVRQYGRLTRLC